MMRTVSRTRGDRQMAGRPRAVCSLALAMLLLASSTLTAPDAGARPSMASFTIDTAISSQDADLIVEGVRLAQDFFIEEIGATVDQSVHVAVRPEAHPVDPSVVAFSMGRSIVFYTGSWGWTLSSPAEKLRIVVHEYTHYYQYLMTGAGHGDTLAWFEEGIAEYLSLVALDGHRILDRADIEAHFVAELKRFPPGVSLAAMESTADFNQIGAAGYPLAYFGVSHLFQSAPRAAVPVYYAALAAGQPGKIAFLRAFDVTPADYYRQFARWVATLGEASARPADIAFIEGVPLASPVRLAPLPESVEAGDQLVVRGRTVEGSICSLSVQFPGGAAPLTRTTFASGDGDVFWLVTISDETPPGPVEVVVECGGGPVSAGFIVEVAPAAPGAAAGLSRLMEPESASGIHVFATLGVGMQRHLSDGYSP